LRNDLRNKTEKVPFSDMVEGSYLFRWAVVEEGYEFDSSLKITPGFYELPGRIDQQPPWLIPRSNSGWMYSPLSIHTLHRDFAKLGNDQNAILQFANKYGLLGTQRVPLAPASGGKLVFGESLERWQEEIGNLARTLAIWDAVNSQSEEKLEGFISWSKDCVDLSVWWDLQNGRYRLLPGNRYSTPKDFEDSLPTGTLWGKLSEILAKRKPEIAPNLLDEWSHGDVFAPALYYVCKEINARLRLHTYPQVLPLRRSEIYIVPANLLTGMWLLFMWEISGKTKLLLCPGCGLWAEQRHKRQKYCSRACRQREYRRRIKTDKC